MLTETDALNLLQSILSKRAGSRPSATEILQHPFLAPYCPDQISQLLIMQPPVFSTKLERDILDRLRHAYVDIETMRESVLQQKCDNLAGWWALVLEREQRKLKRSKKKRRSERYKQRLTETSLSRRTSNEVAIPLQKPVQSHELVDEGTQTLEETVRSQTEAAVLAEGFGKKKKHNLFRGIVDALAHPKQWTSGNPAHGRGLGGEESPRRRSSISSFLSGHKSTSLKSEKVNGSGKKSPNTNMKQPGNGAGNGAGNATSTLQVPKKNDQEAPTTASPDKAVENKRRQTQQTLMRSFTDSDFSRRDLSATRNKSSVSSSLRMTGMHSSDSRRSVSLDRHSSPNSTRRDRRGISRNSTSSSFSSLLSTAQRKSTFSRKSSTSSNSVSSFNTSHSPRSSLRINPTSESFDSHLGRHRPLFMRRRKSTTDDENVSSRSTVGTPRPLYASTQQQRGRFTNETAFYKGGGNSATRNFSADTFFNEAPQPRRRMMMPLRNGGGTRGRKGAPENASEPGLYAGGGSGAGAGGEKEEGIEGIEAVDEEGEYEEDADDNAKHFNELSI